MEHLGVSGVENESNLRIEATLGNLWNITTKVSSPFHSIRGTPRSKAPPDSLLSLLSLLTAPAPAFWLLPEC